MWLLSGFMTPPRQPADASTVEAYELNRTSAG
jgi:hypothetical protein